MVAETINFDKSSWNLIISVEKEREEKDETFLDRVLLSFGS